MYTGMSVKDVDEAIEWKSSPERSIFFIFFVIFGSFFILNLFVGIVISTFNREKEKLGKDFLLTEKQKQWLDMKLLMYRSKPKRLF